MSFFDDIGNFAQGAAKVGQDGLNLLGGAIQAVSPYISIGIGGDPAAIPKRNMVPSTTNRSVNIGGHDPIQGYDVGVWVEDKGRGHKHVLMGQFTGITVTVKNASEPYLPVGSRQPIYFDGEIQIAFELHKGLLDTRVFTETFGFKTFNYLNRYTRSPRFKITFAVDPVDWNALDEDALNFEELHQRYAAGRFVLDFCKIDTWTLGAQAGKNIVATQWTGVAQQIWAEPFTLDNMPDYKSRYYDAKTGDPHDLEQVPTFYYSGFADQSSTTPPNVSKSYSLYPAWMTERMLLEAEKQILLQLRDRIPFHENPNVQRVFQALIDAIDRIERRLGTPGTGKSVAFTDGAIFDGPSYIFGASPDDAQRSFNNDPDSAAARRTTALARLRRERQAVLEELRVTTDPARRAVLEAAFESMSSTIESITRDKKSRSNFGDNGVLFLEQEVQREIEALKQTIFALRQSFRHSEAEALEPKLNELQDRLLLVGSSSDTGSFNDTFQTELMSPSSPLLKDKKSTSDTDQGEFIESLREKVSRETDPDRRKDLQEALNSVLARYNKSVKSRVIRNPEPAEPPTKSTNGTDVDNALMLPNSPTFQGTRSGPEAMLELSTKFRARLQAELTQAESDLASGTGNNDQLSKLVGKLRDDLNIVKSFINGLPPQGSPDPTSSSDG